MKHVPVQKLMRGNNILLLKELLRIKEENERLTTMNEWYLTSFVFLNKQEWYANKRHELKEYLATLIDDNDDIKKILLK